MSLATTSSLFVLGSICIAVVLALLLYKIRQLEIIVDATINKMMDTQTARLVETSAVIIEHQTSELMLLEERLAREMTEIVDLQGRNFGFLSDHIAQTRLLSPISVLATSFVHPWGDTILTRNDTIPIIYVWSENQFEQYSPYLVYEYSKVDDNIFSRSVFDGLKAKKMPFLRFLESGDYEIEIFFKRRDGTMPFYQPVYTILLIDGLQISELSDDGTDWRHWTKRTVLRIEATQHLFVATLFPSQLFKPLFQNRSLSLTCPIVHLHVKKL